MNVEIVKRLRESQCLPFPSGPLVPRAEPGRSLLPGMSPGRCADLAASVMAQQMHAVNERGTGASGDDDDVQGASEDLRANQTARRKTSKSNMTRLMAASAVAWATRHPDLLEAHVDQVKTHPAVGLLAAIYALRTTESPDHRRHAVEGQLGEYFGHRLKPRRLKTDRVDVLPYVSPHYRCSCQRGSDCGTNHSTFTTAQPDEGTVTAVKTLLGQKGAEWWLMARGYLALLFSHMAWLPRARFSAVEQDSLVDRAISLLTNAAARSTEPMDSTVAAGLIVGLTIWPKAVDAGPLKPHWKKAAEYLPTEPDIEDRVLEKTLYCLALAGERGDAMGVSVVPQVARLARETAAALTEPTSAHAVGLIASQCTYLVEAYTKSHKKLKRWVAPVFELGDGLQPPPMPMRPEEFRQALLQRISLLKAYFYWMDTSGLQYVQMARGALPAHRAG